MPNKLIISGKQYHWKVFWRFVYKDCKGDLRQAQIYLFIGRNKEDAFKYARWWAKNKPGQTTYEVDYEKAKMEEWIDRVFYAMPKPPKPVKVDREADPTGISEVLKEVL